MHSTFSVGSPLMLSQMVWSIKWGQHALQSPQPRHPIYHPKEKVLANEEKPKTKKTKIIEHLEHTTNLKLLCFGKRAFLKYCGVSRYCKILIRKAAPLSFSSEETNVVTPESFSELFLLSNTTTCHFKKRKL